MTAKRLSGLGMPAQQAGEVVSQIAAAAADGPVTSVNGETGVVVLDAEDVSAVPAQAPAAYSEVAADIAAVLVAHGMMSPA